MILSLDFRETHDYWFIAVVNSVSVAKGQEGECSLWTASAPQTMIPEKFAQFADFRFCCYTYFAQKCTYAIFRLRSYPFSFRNLKMKIHLRVHLRGEYTGCAHGDKCSNFSGSREFRGSRNYTGVGGPGNQ